MPQPHKDDFTHLRKMLTLYDGLKEDPEIRKRYALVPRLWRHMVVLDGLDKEHVLGVPYETPMPKMTMAPDLHSSPRALLANVVDIKPCEYRKKKDAKEGQKKGLYGLLNPMYPGKDLGPHATVPARAPPRTPPQAPPTIAPTAMTQVAPKGHPKNAEIISLSSDDEQPFHTSIMFPRRTAAAKPVTPPTFTNTDLRASNLETAILSALEASSGFDKAILDFVLDEIIESMKDSELSLLIEEVMDGMASKAEKQVFGDLVRTAQETWRYQQREKAGATEGEKTVQEVEKKENNAKNGRDRRGQEEDAEMCDVGHQEETKRAWQRAQAARGEADVMETH